MKKLVFFFMIASSLPVLAGLNQSQDYVMPTDATVVRYLDRDNRPDATAISLSEAEIEIVDGAIRFNGFLGAIQGNRGFVGFSGVDIPSKLLSFSDQRTELEMTFGEYAPQDALLTVQLLVRDQGSLTTYESNITPKLAIPMRLQLSEFFQSFRGTVSGLGYDGRGEITRVRVFFKRSIIDPQSPAQIPISFSLFL